MTVDKCRVCDGQPLVGWFGLCRQCSDAVARYMIARRRRLALLRDILAGK